MSLLTDLLAQVKRQEPKRNVPPLLRETMVGRGIRARENRFRTLAILLTTLFLLTGLGALYMLDRLGNIKPRTVPPVTVVATRINPLPMAAPKAAAPTMMAFPNVSAAPVHRFAPKEKTARLPLPPEERTPPIQRTTENRPTSSEDPDRDGALQTARALEQRGDDAGALAAYNRALASDPVNHIVMNNMAALYLRSGDLGNATRYATMALQVRKDYVPALINLGIASFRSGKDAQGESCLEQALTLEPANRFALVNLGIHYEKKKIAEKAMACYSRLAEMADSTGYLGLARIAEQQGQIALAVNHYQTVLSTIDRGAKDWHTAEERLKALGRSDLR